MSKINALMYSNYTDNNSRAHQLELYQDKTEFRKEKKTLLFNDWINWYLSS